MELVTVSFTFLKKGSIDFSVNRRQEVFQISSRFITEWAEFAH